MQPEIIEAEVGTIITATGFDQYDKEQMAEYGYGKYPDVVDGLQFERLLSASGPTGGKVLRPSDHKVPKEVVFIQCAGSRDPEQHCAYCSKICCMYTAKHAMLYKHNVPDGQAYVFYIDIRSGGKGYEEFVQRTVEEDDVLYLRGKVSKIFEEDNKIKVWGVDTLTGKHVTIDADMVVMAMAIRPSKGIEELVKKLKIAVDQDGFLSEAHPKLRPVESVTSGMFLAGAAQAPKDIPEAVAQASGASAKAITILSQERLYHSPTVATINVNLCTGCGMCVDVCPYDALSLEDNKAVVNEVLCEGCGTCAATCLRAAVEIKNLTPLQIHEMIRASIGG
jgi:heterodisulfide reductase subunit A